jgi:tetratricopeptide (TPR) repeat protein
MPAVFCFLDPIYPAPKHMMNLKVDRKRFIVITICFVIIFSSIFLTYSNSFNASWHFDDFDNIPNNQALHITDLQPKSLVSTFFAYPFSTNKEILSRPVSNLTFALNWYWGNDDVFGYHIVNVSIHCLAALFLFLFLVRLYDTTPLANTDRNLIHTIALFATLLWALNPVQTQAITYIVQRMAALAAMFYIAALYFYLRARQTASPRSLLYYGCMILSTVLAIGSKENAATLPFALVLLEIVFFRDRWKQNNFLKIILVTSGIILPLIAGIFFLQGDPLSFLKGYDSRSFTLGERLLTEPRIVTLYLSQLFFPAPSRLSLEHDITLSTSLFTPWTTLPALAFLSILLCYGLFCYKQRPIISLSILFYLLNHLVESTVLPLELIFEHRNYLPSMFLFAPVADYIARKINYYKYAKKSISVALKYISITVLLSFGFGTYLRNMAWISEESLWQDTIQKAPYSARAAYNLGKVYLKSGQIEHALVLFNRAEYLADSSPAPKNLRNWAYNGIGSVYLLNDKPEDALVFFKKALVEIPSDPTSHYNIVMLHFYQDRWEEATFYKELLQKSDPNNIDYIYMDSIIFINKNKTLPSEENTRKLRTKSPNNIILSMILARSLKNSEFYDESYYHFKIYNHETNNILTKIEMLEIAEILGKKEDVFLIKNDLKIKFSKDELQEAVNHNTKMNNKFFKKVDFSEFF